jgi:hypothetical protein
MCGLTKWERLEFSRDEVLLLTAVVVQGKEVTSTFGRDLTSCFPDSFLRCYHHYPSNSQSEMVVVWWREGWYRWAKICWKMLLLFLMFMCAGQSWLYKNGKCNTSPGQPICWEKCPNFPPFIPPFWQQRSCCLFISIGDLKEKQFVIDNTRLVLVWIYESIPNNSIPWILCCFLTVLCKMQQVISGEKAQSLWLVNCTMCWRNVLARFKIGQLSESWPCTYVLCTEHT